MLFLRQLGLILWKNFYVYRLKRHYIVTAFETFFPLLLCIIIVVLRSKVGPIDSDGSGAFKRVNYTVYEEMDPLTLGYLSAKVIMYAPNTTYTTAMMTGLAETMYKVKIQAFNSTEELEKKLADPDLNSSTLGFIFHEAGDNPTSLRYTVRSEDLQYPTIYDFDQGPRYIYYSENSLSRVVAWMNKLHFDFHNLTDYGENDTRPSLYVRRFPYPSYLEDSTFGSMAIFIPMVIVYGFILTCPIFVKRIVDEKPSRIKELLRMMGLSDWVYWLGTFLNGFFIMFIISILMAILFVSPFGEYNVAVLESTNFFIVFITILLYCVSALQSCMLISCFFSKPTLGVIAAILFWVLSYNLPSTLLDPIGGRKYQSVTKGQKLGSALLPNMGLYWCFRIIGYFELLGSGMSIDKWNAQLFHGDATLLEVQGIMLISCFIYGILVWYVDNVWPWQLGIPKPLHFPFMLSYWFPGRNTEVDSEDKWCTNVEYFEAEPRDREVSVSMKNLTKSFGFGRNKKTAVNSLNLNMYHGQITALLGHNGAGKTTTMNMLTGLFPPSCGSVAIDGYDVFKQTRKARSSLGLCPQHNVLFDMMTVREHLYFFAGLKGFPSAKVTSEIDQVVQRVSLTDKLDTLAKDLSGGMKRKLSLGNALIGDSKILILDEPTAGLDPQARRAIWDLLQHIRDSRTVLLTTHYMEEADVLGNRIAIMADGVIQCCGSPLFLKRKYGTGYQMRIVKGNNYDEELVKRVVQEYIPPSEIVSDINHEVMYHLTDSSSDTLGALFEHVESMKQKDVIRSIGVSVTTMEDVFLKVGSGMSQEMSKAASEGSLDHFASNGSLDSEACMQRDTDVVTGVQKLLLQARALFEKRFHHTRRSWAVPLFAFVVPFAILFAFGYLYNGTSKTTEDQYPLTLDKFGRTTVVQNFPQNLPLKEMYDKVIEQRNSDPLDKQDINSFVLDVGTKDMSVYRNKYIVGAEGNRSKLVAWFNGETVYANAISLMFLSEALLREMSGDPEARIEVTNHPIASRREKISSNSDLGGRILVSTFFPIALSYLAASFVLFTVHERITNAKHLQLMTGLPGSTYWLCNFAWDAAVYIVCSTLFLIPIVAFDHKGVFVGNSTNTGALVLLLYLYGFCAIPLTYLLSFIPKLPSTGFAIVTTINIVTGVLLCIAITMVDSLSYIPSLNIDKNALEVSLWFCRLIPIFSLTWGVANIYQLDTCRRATEIVCTGPALNLNPCCGYNCLSGVCEASPFDFLEKTSGRDMLFLFIDSLILIMLLIMVETNFFQALKNKLCGKLDRVVSGNHIALSRQMSVIDDDVTGEKRHVDELVGSGLYMNEALVASHLSKTFNNLTAVKDMCFTVRKQECFGLLGVNGAGKTTTFKMLTGDLPMTSGDAYIGAYTLSENLRQFQTKIGYCPQFDALIDNLTGRETLSLFASLRGIKPSVAKRVINDLINMADLRKHADKRTQDYSGGNRRKLSLALALIGDPPVVFLDEPTAGVDPASRRKIWKALVTAQRNCGMSIILTSHSMEECEALCSRLGIMVNGEFRCLGGTQHLKNKFGQGFTVIVKLNAEQAQDNQHTETIHTEICAAFRQQCVLKDSHQGLLHYHITDTSLSWSFLFKSMSNLKNRYKFEDFVVSDTSLEQIFLSFARSQIISE